MSTWYHANVAGPSITGTSRPCLPCRAGAIESSRTPSISQSSPPARQCCQPHLWQFRKRPSRGVCRAVPLPEALTAGLFAASTIYTAALGLLMMLAPRWRRTQELMRPATVLLPLAAVYAGLLLCSWERDTFSLILPGSWEEGFKGGFNPQFFPQLGGIMQLFSRLVTAASLWVHLMAINLFAARTVYLQGLEFGIPTWHSILLCMTLSPLGLLAHLLTKALWNRNSRAA